MQSSESESGITLFQSEIRALQSSDEPAFLGKNERRQRYQADGDADGGRLRRLAKHRGCEEQQGKSLHKPVAT